MAFTEQKLANYIIDILQWLLFRNMKMPAIAFLTYKMIQTLEITWTNTENSDSLICKIKCCLSVLTEPFLPNRQKQVFYGLLCTAKPISIQCNIMSHIILKHLEGCLNIPLRQYPKIVWISLKSFFSFSSGLILTDEATVKIQFSYQMCLWMWIIN